MLRLEVPMPVTTKIIVFWNVRTCTSVNMHQSFGSTWHISTEPLGYVSQNIVTLFSSCTCNIKLDIPERNELDREDPHFVISMGPQKGVRGKLQNKRIATAATERVIARHHFLSETHTTRTSLRRVVINSMIGKN
jgi:hypothetical protein